MTINGGNQIRNHETSVRTSPRVVTLAVTGIGALLDVTTPDEEAPMRISDPGTGITRESLEFYRDHRHELGDVREVTVRFPGYDDPHDPYLLVLRDSRGDELRLSGCTTGYVGEGPHGTMRLLIEEGCPVVHAMVVLRAATATFARENGDWVVSDYTLANVPDPHVVPEASNCARPCAAAMDM